MKLRKALDKAKENRGENNRSVSVKNKKPPASSDEWHAPIYSESLAVEINYQKAIDNHCIAFSPEFPEINYYKVLRTQIRQMSKTKGWNTVMITSVSPGEGKTVTAINLAAVFAKEYNQTVLLVDADLKRQTIHKYLGYHSSHGLIDYLEDKKPLNEIIVWPGVEKLTLISGGRTVADSAELLGAPRMQELVNNLKVRYNDRFIIFDVPPVQGCADALAFAPFVDGIIFVVEVDKPKIQDVKKAMELLPEKKIAGFVLNRIYDPSGLYGKYGYGY